MSRTLDRWIFVFTLASVGCSKTHEGSPSSSSTAHAAAPSSKSGTSFTNGGAGACAKYLSPEIIAKVIGGPVRTPKVLSPQSCTVERTDDAGSITITLDNATEESFRAYQQYLSDPKPLAGVGDEAVQSMLGISSIKKPNMGCDIDAGGAPGSLNESHEALGKDLGDICNKIYADAH